jgi:hypothetical protein
MILFSYINSYYIFEFKVYGLLPENNSDNVPYVVVHPEIFEAGVLTPAAEATSLATDVQFLSLG